MNRIERLPEVVANQIAAGEVVLRPANVVKELVENAVDAGARTIRIESQGGGIARVFILDDGHGMNREDAQLCIERHATSKLRRADDLDTISTLGFRGEALPSIASVSRVVIRTRTRDQDEGTEVQIHGGTTKSVGPCGCPAGTSVTVDDLFYNVPARRKFLRAVSTESAHITEVVRGCALAHPEIAFHHRRDGRDVHRFLACAGRAERAADVLSCRNLVASQGTRGPIEIEAHLAPAESARSRASSLLIMVNDRPVQERAIVRAVANAYGESLPHGQYPVGVVYIDLPPNLVDVNVHPQKAEVRFAHARAVTDAVYSVIVKTMGGRISHTDASAPRTPLHHARPESDSRPWTWRGSASHEPPPHSPARREPLAGSSEQATTPPATPRRSLVGVSHDRFLILEDAETLRIVDGHVLCQLDVLRTARTELERGKLSSQLLLFPVDVPLTPAIVAQVKAHTEEAATLGFDLEIQQPHSLRVRGVPRCLAMIATERLVSAWTQAIVDDVRGTSSLLRHLSASAVPSDGLSISRANELLGTWKQASAEERAEATTARLDRSDLERA